MKITARLILSFLLVSVLPLALLGYLMLQSMESIRALAVEESGQALRQLGEGSIHQKAVDVARQVELYLESHPELLQQPPQEWAANPELAAIAVQPVGSTGYTALYDQTGVVYCHANPQMIGRDMHELAQALPSFWALFKTSLDGAPVASYYQWQDPDGSLRDKYMSCVSVGDSPFRIAATTYIDEFSQPVHHTEEHINTLFQVARGLLLVFLLVLGLLALLLGVWLARGIGRPILSIAGAARKVEAGQYQADFLETVARRKDELGELARLFLRMAGEVRAREQSLQQQVQELRIEIDEARKQRQVEEITETEYFQGLLERIDLLKRRHSS